MFATNKIAISRPLMPRIDGVGQWMGPLGLRVILAWEFYEAGRQKLQGQNWFADVGDKFPLPFSLVSPEVNWAAATWVELIAGVLLLVGLGTRYAAAALWVLTIVAIYAVHWPAEWSSLAELWQGYAISNDGYGNYKLPLIYMVMLLPLMLTGPGRFSLDHLINAKRGASKVARADSSAWGVVLLAIGATLSLLLPWLGGALVIGGLGLMNWPRRTASNGVPSMA